jgi:hypothetical protein
MIAVDPGWTFTGWSGDVTDNEVTIAGNTIVTATFTQDEYTLTLNKVGEGTVTADVAGSYHYGTEVEVTAMPAPGWSFRSWSANVNGGKVTITGNTTVTATFTQDEYLLNVTVAGNGTIIRDNNGPYHYGDVVKLTGYTSVRLVILRLER